MNEYVNLVLLAAIDPDLADDEVQRLRERLARAGLLADTDPSRAQRPDRAEFERARAKAGQGTPASDLVSENRR